MYHLLFHLNSSDVAANTFLGTQIMEISSIQFSVIFENIVTKKIYSFNLVL